MRVTFVYILLLVPLAIALATFPDYPARRAKECAVSAENTGVVIGLETVETSEAQKMYFGANLVKNGFVPVFVVIENGMSSNSVIFDKTKVTYGVLASALPIPQPGSIGGKTVALSAIPFAGGFAAARVISSDLQVRANLLEKELQSTTISPGKSVHGFLYVPSKNKSSREKIRLQIPVGKAGTDDTLDLGLDF
jgi:hypothetical protein